MAPRASIYQGLGFQVANLASYAVIYVTEEDGWALLWWVFAAPPLIGLAASAALRDVVQDLDESAVAAQYIRLSVGRQRARFSARGSTGTVEIDVPRDAFVLKPRAYRGPRLVLNARRLALDVDSTTEVIVPDLTMVATANAARVREMPGAVRRQGFIQRPHDTARIQLVLGEGRARFPSQLIQGRGRPVY